MYWTKVWRPRQPQTALVPNNVEYQRESVSEDFNNHNHTERGTLYRQISAVCECVCECVCVCEW